MLEKTNIESLPDDAIFDILVRVPAQDMYKSARFVCPRWFHLARAHDFVHAHLHQSTHGLLIQEFIKLITPHRIFMDSSYDRPILVGTRNGRIEISNFENYRFIGRVMSSCNGLILETYESSNNHLYITNPTTKQQIALPTNKSLQSSAMAYAGATKEYKVVQAFHNDENSKNSTPDGIAILTVGVDMDWTRRVDIQHLSLEDRWLLTQPPLATQGFVHWAEEEDVLTLNVENEAITKSRVPTCLRREGEKLGCHYLSTGSSLSVLIGRTEFSWEVWEMESEAGEWRKVMIVDLEGQKGVLEAEMGSGCWMKPIGWLKFGEVLVFSSGGDRVKLYSHSVFAFAYNVGTHGIESFELDSFSTNFVVHRNSLVWLN